ncbi:predicted protein [Aspergillus nidulans FGSC A4]|uniref:Uncharacterized protein n=1 Tax=Emericella nidulans (strain FGSC A4 / ATCC 38163 / CBS 112.46 / NRRL 194 / M139) TaxID=227321 RepID=Q5BF82_EMENI|nr:hypothetical protein [Aspergillus nidulans FGSC A4]EAA65628.1 predicted protein [Aspergillus nidulans FGSC A4]CBF88761.1 TPA: conserved hypothetical protein [Aspergillus nidulans FGSC A4]|eukprot:XP_658402.1 predicted protein [Aspergillus nidulans FGSC A4]
MPTATATLSWKFTNWGPLTTPWSLPDSCTSNVAIASTADTDFVLWAELCPFSFDSCYPSPTDSNAPEALSSALNTHGTDIYAPPFYSPAPACPNGWKTVGVAARDGDATASRAGWFTTIYEGEQLDDIDSEVLTPAYNQVLAGLLDADETAVVCCPSSMTMLPGFYCSSSLPSYTVSTACEVFHRGDITDLPSLRESSVTWTTTTTTYSAEETPEFTGWSQVAPLLLFHKPTDVARGGDDDAGANDVVDSAGETNAAAPGYGRESFWGVGVKVAASAVGSMLAGAAFILLR